MSSDLDFSTASLSAADLAAEQGTDTSAAPTLAPHLTGFPEAPRGPSGPRGRGRRRRHGQLVGPEVVASGVAELVGVADLVEGAPQKVIEQSGAADPSAIAAGTDGVDLALEVGADLLIDPTVPVAHHPVTVKALHAGIPVLGEKPVTENLHEAISLLAHTQLTGVPFMVSQSRRFFRQVRQLRSFVAAHGPTVLTSAFFSLFTEMEGYRRTQQHPLLRDMGIHAFDTARYIMDADPVAVTARGAQPGVERLRA